VPRPRKRALGLLCGAGLLFFLGTNVQAGWLFVIAACLLGSVIVGVALPSWMLRGVGIECSAPPRVHQREDVDVELHVVNGSGGMRLGLVLDDERFAPVTLAVRALRPNERVTIATRRSAGRRGPVGIGSVRARSSAPFGIAEARRVLHLAGPQTLVLPVVVPLGQLSFVHPAATSDRAMHPWPRRGTGPEYLGIREYRAGDSIRHVHWPSTARTGTVMVREFEQEQTRRLAILVDAAWDAGEAWTPLDRVCAVAASVAMAALAQGHGTRLVVPAGADVEVLARTDGAELLERLARLTPAPTPSFLTMIADAGSLRGVESVVLAFPARRGNDPATLVPAVAALAGQTGQVVAVPVEIDADEAPEEALAEGDWTRLEESLRTAGAEVYPWRRGDDLAMLLGEPMTDRGVAAGTYPS
jgi:uncharacterized protein (DUF58 family)